MVTVTEYRRAYLLMPATVIKTNLVAWCSWVRDLVAWRSWVRDLVAWRSWVRDLVAWRSWVRVPVVSVHLLFSYRYLHGATVLIY